MQVHIYYVVSFCVMNTSVMCTCFYSFSLAFAFTSH